MAAVKMRPLVISPLNRIGMEAPMREKGTLERRRVLGVVKGEMTTPRTRPMIGMMRASGVRGERGRVVKGEMTGCCMEGAFSVASCQLPQRRVQVLFLVKSVVRAGDMTGE